MRKLLLVSILALIVMLVGCGTKTTQVDLTTKKEAPILTEEPLTKAEVVNEDEWVDEDKKEPLFDKEVDIILGFVSMDNTTIEDEIISLQAENPDIKYAVYDEGHYSMTIKESERVAFLEQLNTEEGLPASFQGVFNSEDFAGVFVNVEYDELLQNVTYLANKDAFGEKEFIVVLGTYIVTSVIQDTVQAYNLIPPEERVYNIKILDAQTKEVLYDANDLNE